MTTIEIESKQMYCILHLDKITYTTEHICLLRLPTHLFVNPLRHKTKM